MMKISKQEKQEGTILITFFILSIIFFLLKNTNLIWGVGCLLLVVLLILWIKNTKSYIEKSNRQVYNTLMFILSIYAKSGCLISFMFRLTDTPFHTEVALVAHLSMLIYIIISLVNKEYRNALWGFIYKMIY